MSHAVLPRVVLLLRLENGDLASDEKLILASNEKLDLATEIGHVAAPD